MDPSAEFLNASEAARRLGVSAKALRLYEQRGLIAPTRTAAGWRTYGPGEMRRCAEIAALRALGLSLRETARILDGDLRCMESDLAAHQAALEGNLRDLAGMIEAVRELRDGLARGEVSTAAAQAGQAHTGPVVAFDLPWPWGGERYEFRDIRLLNYIVGPLGSGKTRFARRLAETLPDAAFLGLNRLADGGAAALTDPSADPTHGARTERTLRALVDDGAVRSDALTALITGLETEGPSALVVDMVEQGLDHASQEALIAWLRRRQSGRGPDCRPLFLLTRSSTILDLDAVGAGEAIYFCPANHSPPIRVVPCVGGAGHEALASCLASPEVRARTDGVIAWRPQVA